MIYRLSWFEERFRSQCLTSTLPYDSSCSAFKFWSVTGGVCDSSISYWSIVEQDEVYI